MAHPAQHEERILRHALADPGLAEGERSALAAQVAGCPECLAFGYRALADLPVFLAATGMPPAAVARWTDRSAGRVEALLAEALAPSPVAAAPGGLAALFQRLGSHLPAPALAAALALVLLVLTGAPFLRKSAVAPAFARAQLRLVLEALPAGYGFLSAPPSPFWRGYARGLLGDLGAAGLGGEDAQVVRGVLLRSSGAGQGGGRLGCDGPALGEEDRAECRHGEVAYRLRRALADGVCGDALLASAEGAAALLAWAGPDGRRLAAEGATPRATEAQWEALVEELLRRR